MTSYRIVQGSSLGGLWTQSAFSVYNIVQQKILLWFKPYVFIAIGCQGILLRINGHFNSCLTNSERCRKSSRYKSVRRPGSEGTQILAPINRRSRSMCHFVDLVKLYHKVQTACQLRFGVWRYDRFVQVPLAPLPTAITYSKRRSIYLFIIYSLTILIWYTKDYCNHKISRVMKTFSNGRAIDLRTEKSSKETSIDTVARSNDRPLL